MTTKLLTIEELCRTLGIGKTTAYQLVKQMKHVKIGRRILVPETELLRYIQDHIKSEASSDDTNLQI